MILEYHRNESINLEGQELAFFIYNDTLSLCKKIPEPERFKVEWYNVEYDKTVIWFKEEGTNVPVNNRVMKQTVEEIKLAFFMGQGLAELWEEVQEYTALTDHCTPCSL